MGIQFLGLDASIDVDSFLVTFCKKKIGSPSSSLTREHYSKKNRTKDSKTNDCSLQ